MSHNTNILIHLIILKIISDLFASNKRPECTITLWTYKEENSNILTAKDVRLRRVKL